MAQGRFRFRISTLIAIVLCVGPTLALARESGDAWIVALFFICGMLIHGVVATSIVGSIFARGVRRAYWAGFAVFSGSWLLLLWCFFLLVGADFEPEILLLGLSVPPFGFVGGQIARGIAESESSRSMHSPDKDS